MSMSVSMLHSCATCPCTTVHVHIAYSCCMFMLPAHAASSCCISMSHNHSCFAMLHAYVQAACPCCMSLLHVHASCPCCMLMSMSVLNEHAVCHACRAKRCDWTNSQDLFEKLADSSFCNPKVRGAADTVRGGGEGCAAFHVLSFANSNCNTSFFWAALTDKRFMRNTKRRHYNIINSVQRHILKENSINWYNFSPTLVFAGQYL
jgi:hypothetical protein